MVHNIRWTVSIIVNITLHIFPSIRFDFLVIVKNPWISIIVEGAIQGVVRVTTKYNVMPTVHGIAHMAHDRVDIIVHLRAKDKTKDIYVRKS